MSGGSYNYAYEKLEEFADSLQDVGGCGDYAAPPELRMKLAAHCRLVAKAMRACEWNDSNDGDREETAKILAVIAPTADESSHLQRQLLRQREAIDAALKVLGAKP